jgi:hypothetical protein
MPNPRTLKSVNDAGRLVKKSDPVTTEGRRNGKAVTTHRIPAGGRCDSTPWDQEIIQSNTICNVLRIVSWYFAIYV